MSGLKRIFSGSGQGLVEFAIIAPVLIFMLIGLFEVGWALRGYLVLAHANREAARFAVRNNYLDFKSNDVGYERVVSHTFAALSEQIPFGEHEDDAIIVSHLFVDVQFVCEPGKPCDCEFAVANPYSPTLILSPLSLITYTYTWPVTSTQKTRLDYQQYGLELVAQNRRLQCEFQNRMPPGFLLRPDSVIVVEMFYFQPQLFGFPLLSNPITDPVPMYVHSAFRILEERKP